MEYLDEITFLNHREEFRPFEQILSKCERLYGILVSIEILLDGNEYELKMKGSKLVGKYLRETYGREDVKGVRFCRFHVSFGDYDFRKGVVFKLNENLTKFTEIANEYMPNIKSEW